MTSSDPGPVLSGHAGLVEAPADQVRDLVLAVPTGSLHGDGLPLVIGGPGAQPAVVSGSAGHFRAEIAGTTMTIDVDHDAGWVQARGQWWYCGRFAVEDDPRGALVRQRTYNCATGIAGKLVPFTVGRGHREGGRRALQHLLETVGERLGCRTELLSD